MPTLCIRHILFMCTYILGKKKNKNYRVTQYHSVALNNTYITWIYKYAFTFRMKMRRTRRVTCTCVHVCTRARLPSSIRALDGGTDLTVFGTCFAALENEIQRQSVKTWIIGDKWIEKRAQFLREGESIRENWSCIIACVRINLCIGASKALKNDNKINRLWDVLHEKSNGIYTHIYVYIIPENKILDKNRINR